MPNVSLLPEQFVFTPSMPSYVCLFVSCCTRRTLSVHPFRPERSVLRRFRLLECSRPSPGTPFSNAQLGFSVALFAALTPAGI
eukprot:2279829-Pleurochrysis_carterae.AAC.1